MAGDVLHLVLDVAIGSGSGTVAGCYGERGTGGLSSPHPATATALGSWMRTRNGGFRRRPTVDAPSPTSTLPFSLAKLRILLHQRHPASLEPRPTIRSTGPILTDPPHHVCLAPSEMSHGPGPPRTRAGVRTAGRLGAWSTGKGRANAAAATRGNPRRYRCANPGVHVHVHAHVQTGSGDDWLEAER
ncbi:hypothetical protein M427DRAFT_30287 [Gonapodya prolifera JEL478]|uniref:Uncharacterized protein n=1 Tax=Gonapodya prolifera (strain JEL478) TaxID=1344416 RepID=A0A139AM59_GONPJ|nr:hypothetical protein M427DRAFT_30287 [Gonapodya prolifera JEL478]|eukprot:KXS17842.1 hypothetical protein M427DRAFT_30287 [Gonapodya prolifera JEL478]